MARLDYCREKYSILPSDVRICELTTILPNHLHDKKGKGSITNQANFGFDDLARRQECTGSSCELARLDYV